MKDQKAIENFLNRGVENVYPSKEAVQKMLVKASETGHKLTVYMGIDPTAPTLHMGHAIPLMKLAEFQKLGHKVVLLMGDFTAMIGDPDKMAVRKPLTKQEVLKNLRLYKKQASKFIKFGGFSGAKIKYNSKWLSKMKFADVLDLASHMTVQQMMERDMFSNRLKEGKPIHVHEFMYPLMQGYDSVAMDVDGEIGGNDQTFNMLTGRNLLRTVKNKEKFVLTTKLLVDQSGKKMGKSEGNMITMMDSAKDVFGKVMSWPDSMIISGFELCTKISDEDIKKEQDFLKNGGNPRDAKLRLAHTITAIYHGDKLADSAKEGFVGAFSNGSIPADVSEIVVNDQSLLVDVLVSNKTVASKTEFRRLASEGAIKNLKTGEAIKEFDYKISGDLDLKIGKHRFLKIRIR